jgi:site-specific DNA-methyltransferase (adenine-specific)
MEIDNIYNMDCLEGMRQMEAESVDCIVTSPPYFLNKQYEKTWDYEYYCHLMKNVFYQCKRVLKSGGYLIVNFGDYFNSGNRFYDAQVPSVYPASINYFDWGSQNDFDLQATRIWRKQFAKCSIPIVCNTHPRNVFDYEHVWTFRKKGENGNEFVNDRKLSQKGVIGENWNSTAGLQEHPAAFPIELPRWAINVYSNEGNVILDPFIGSGTTAIACIKERRHFIGFELNKEYFDKACKRIKAEQAQLTLF